MCDFVNEQSYQSLIKHTTIFCNILLPHAYAGHIYLLDVGLIIALKAKLFDQLLLEMKLETYTSTRKLTISRHQNHGFQTLSTSYLCCIYLK